MSEGLASNQDSVITARDLEKFDSCILWLETLRTDHTRKNFKLHLSLFCRFCNSNPDQMVTWSSQEIKQKVLEYIVHLKRNAKRKAQKPKVGEVSVNSLRTYLTGVQSFFVFHDKDVNWKKLYRYLPEKVRTKLRAYSKEEIRRLLEFADPRDRAIILIMVSGGPRRGAFPSMTVGDVSMMDDNLKIGLLKVYPDSENDHYATLLTPECMDAIGKYLDWREKQGEKISPTSPLIRDKFDVATRHRNEPKPLQEESIHAQVVRVAKTSGVYSEDLAPDHSFRYFFNTTLMNSDVNEQFKELMMGHSINLDDVYYKAETPQSRQKILSEYMKAVDALTIDDEYRLRMKVQELENRVDTIAELRAMVEHQDERIETWMNYIAGHMKGLEKPSGKLTIPENAPEELKQRLRALQPS